MGLEITHEGLYYSVNLEEEIRVAKAIIQKISGKSQGEGSKSSILIVQSLWKEFARQISSKRVCLSESRKNRSFQHMKEVIQVGWSLIDGVRVCEDVFIEERGVNKSFAEWSVFLVSYWLREGR